jgi:hypothetical protein
MMKNQIGGFLVVAVVLISLIGHAEENKHQCSKKEKPGCVCGGSEVVALPDGRTLIRDKWICEHEVKQPKK